VYAGLPSECVDCHLDDYNSTDDPNHAEAGFPTTCETCHDSTSFEDADFDHATFPLVGTHATLECASCHSSGVYAGLPSECVDCHLDDYNGTNDPDHLAAGFPTTCDSCHRASDTSWDQGVFVHTAFPLPHRNADCQDCHIDSATFAVFSCLSGGCHPQSETDSHHREEGDAYRYDSAFCYSCHPDGRAEDDKRLRMRSSHAPS
jgi:hypothetical protein